MPHATLNCFRSAVIRRVGILVVGFFVASTSFAGHLAGIRLTQTGVNDLTVDIDITVLYTLGATASSADLGVDFVENSIPAIQWHLGDVTLDADLPLVATSTDFNGTPVRMYRGSFSHSYGIGRLYTIKARMSAEFTEQPLLTGEFAGTTLVDTLADPGTGGNRSHSFYVTFAVNTLTVDLRDIVFDDAFENGDLSGWPKVITEQPPE